MGRSVGAGQGVLLSRRHHLSFLQIVRRKLGAMNMRDVDNGPFGHLFNVPTLNFQGQLHNIMCKVLRSSSRVRSCLQFEIANSLVEFGPADFALVSRLTIGGPIAAPTKSDFHRTVFNGVKKVSFLDIKDRFLVACKADRNSHLSLQLAYLYILYGVILMDGRLETGVLLRFIHLVEDLDKFKAFPWGRVSYEVLVRRTHDLKLEIDTLKDRRKDRNCEAPAFLDVLQVWLYEICNHVASHCATEVVPAVQHPARILRWTSDRRTYFDELYRLFRASCGYEPQPIKLTPAEEGMLSELGIDDTMKVANPVSLTRVPRVKKRKEGIVDDGKMRKRSSVRLKPNAENVCEKEETKLPDNVGEDIISYLKNAIAEGMKQLRGEMKANETNLSCRLHKMEQMLDQLQEVCNRFGSKSSHNPMAKDAALDAEVGSKDNLVKETDAMDVLDDGEEDVVEANEKVEKSVSSKDESLDGEVGSKDNVRKESDAMDISVDGEEDVDDASEKVEKSVSRKDASVDAEVGSKDNVQKESDAMDTSADGEEDVDEASEKVEKSVSSKDCMPSSLNPIRSVESPPCSADSLDRVMHLVTANANEMARGSTLSLYVQPRVDFDVSHIKWDNAKFVPFNDWLKCSRGRTRSKSSVVNVKLPSDSMRWADEDFMPDLLKARGWLSNFHVDALLNLVVYEFDLHFRCRKWAVLDMRATNCLVSKNFKAMEIKPYVDGKLPTVGRIPWEFTNCLFGCGNVGQNHWVLFKACFHRQEVIVFDTLGISKDEIVAYFEDLSHNIAKALRTHKVWEKQQRGISPSIPLRDSWDVVVYEDAPQQGNLSDYGVLCIKVLKCLTRNIPFTELKTNRCTIYRRSFCAKLCDWSTRFQKKT